MTPGAQVGLLEVEVNDLKTKVASLQATVAGLALIAFSGSATDLVAGTVPDGRLVGSYTQPVALTNASNLLTGNGIGVTGVNAAYLNDFVVVGGKAKSDASGEVSFGFPQPVFTTSFMVLLDLNFNNIVAVADKSGVTFGGLAPNTDYLVFAVGK